MVSEPGAPLPKPRGSAFARLMIGHMVAYPIAFLWAAASVPVLIWMFDEELFRIADEADMARFLTMKMLYPAALAALVAHGVALPWAFMKDETRGKRWFLWALGALAGVGLLFGAVGWAVLLLRDG